MALSFFSFFQGWFFQPGEVSLDEFVTDFWLARGIPASRMQNASYFHHLVRICSLLCVRVVCMCVKERARVRLDVCVSFSWSDVCVFEE